MTVYYKSDLHLAGYESYGEIWLRYNFPDGTQGPEHLNPGKPYKGGLFWAFLPGNEEGHKVRKLLRKAFNQRLTFTIGQSEQLEDCVMLRDIPHKIRR
jgi:deltex-like protein